MSHTEIPVKKNRDWSCPEKGNVPFLLDREGCMNTTPAERPYAMDCEKQKGCTGPSIYKVTSTITSSEAKASLEVSNQQ